MLILGKSQFSVGHLERVSGDLTTDGVDAAYYLETDATIAVDPLTREFSLSAGIDARANIPFSKSTKALGPASTMTHHAEVNLLDFAIYGQADAKAHFLHKPQAEASIHFGAHAYLAAATLKTKTKDYDLAGLSVSFELQLGLRYGLGAEVEAGFASYKTKPGMSAYTGLGLTAGPGGKISFATEVSVAPDSFWYSYPEAIDEELQRPVISHDDPVLQGLENSDLSFDQKMDILADRAEMLGPAKLFFIVKRMLTHPFTHQQDSVKYDGQPSRAAFFRPAAPAPPTNSAALRAQDVDCGKGEYSP